MMIKKIRENIKENLIVDRINAIEWIVLAVVLILCFLTLFYYDNLGMFLVYFWTNEGLFNWSDIHFLGSNQLPYGLFQQFFCELWTLPVNLAYRFYRFEVANTLTVLWFKGCIAFVFVLCTLEIQKIAIIIGVTKERCKWLLILFSSTILVALPVFHIAQTDIIYTYLILRGIRALFMEDRRGFIVFFALAVSCKMFTLVVLLPLILLTEKRVLYILKDFILSVIIIPLQMIWYKIVDFLNSMLFAVNDKVGAVDITASESVDVQGSERLILRLLRRGMNFEISAIRKDEVASVLVILLILLFVWCYEQHIESQEELFHRVLYASTATWLIFFIALCDASPYWIVVLYPFIFLLVIKSDMKLRINLILMNAFTLSIFAIYVYSTYWVYGGSCNLEYLLLRKMNKASYGLQDGPNVAGYLAKLHIYSMNSIIVAICVASAIALLAINYRRCNSSEYISEEEQSKVLHGFTIFQVAVLGIWYLLCVWSASSW